MVYALGVDLGTTYTAAAVAKNGRVEIVHLGNRAAAVPSVLYLGVDAVLTGEPALRRAVNESDRVAREFKRRVGDPAPLLLAGAPHSAESLIAKLLRWVVDTVSELEGGPPDSVAVCHPTNWGRFKIDLLEQAARMADLEDVRTITEPEAAALHYDANERVEAGAVIAVYDLGGGTFDAAVLRKSSEGFELLGRPEGIERLGGIDFDEAVFAHVRSALGDVLQHVDPNDPATINALAHLRIECVDAKEALSSDTEVDIPVVLPNHHTDVRLTRSEFEEMVRPALSDTIGALRRALRSAHVEPEELSAVLLVGGSSRIPLVAQMVGAELRRPVAVDAHPKHAVALGAAIAAQRALDDVAPVAPSAPPAPAAALAAEAAEAAGPGTPAPSAPPVAEPIEGARPANRGRLLAGAAVAVLVVVAIAAAVVLRNDDGGTDVTTGATTTTTIAEAVAPTTTAAPTPFVDVTGITKRDGIYDIAFTTTAFAPSFEAASHVHFFWDTTPRATAGTNGVPKPGAWLAYGGSSPAHDAFFTIASRPRGATAICALVGTHDHAIADVDGDGTPDPDSGGCAPLPA
jgi:actin-like ATPase involved in cell morphogenesis